MSKKLIIAAALTGAWPTKSMSPYVPMTPDEIAADAVACVKAGASMLHIHVRDDNEKGSMDTERFKAAYYAVTKALDEAGLDAVINLTTSGQSGVSDETRMAHLIALKPEMCSFDAGSMNWGANVFMNSPAFLEKLCHCVLENDIKPEIEVFNGSMMVNAAAYVKKGLLKQPTHYQFVLGGAGAMEGTVHNLNFFRNMLPEGSTWSVTGVGKAHLPMLLAALAMDADGVRVGLEDNLYYAHGQLATNAQLVERAATLGRLAGREPATAAEARELLDITRRHS